MSVLHWRGMIVVGWMGGGDGAGINLCIYLFTHVSVHGMKNAHARPTQMTEEEALAAARARGHWEDYKTIFTNPYFVYGLAGVTANCFCL